MVDGVVDIPSVPVSVITTRGPNPNPEGEMDALLLGRTKVSCTRVLCIYYTHIGIKQNI